jgi:hypothetical protein
MAWKNIDERRETVSKVLSAGIEIKGREAKALSVVFGCSQSAIQADVKVIRAEDRRSSPLESASS